jgi:hypothetical protein
MANNNVGPFGSPVRFSLVAAKPGESETLKKLGTYGFIKGARAFIIGAIKHSEKNLEDYGYLMEQVILFATSLGLGTCWLGAGSKMRFPWETLFFQINFNNPLSTQNAGAYAVPLNLYCLAPKNSHKVNQ